MQEAFIHKKLLYKFDKKIELLFQSICNLQNPDSQMLDQAQQTDKKVKYLSKEAILQEIEQLKFLNFKYRTTLLSAQKDQTSNQAILQKAESQIIDARTEVDKQSHELQHQVKCKRNKETYNHLAESLKQTFQPLAVQNQKLTVITKEIDDMQKKYEKQVNEYHKKQKCLRLALSALKCVIESQDAQQSDGILSQGLYVAQTPLSNGIEHKVSQPSVSPGLVNGSGNNSSREEGEQLEGGEIAY